MEQTQALTIPTQDREIIRARLLDLLDITVATMQAQKLPMQQRLMINGATPIITMGIQKESILKLSSFLTCLEGILKAVNALDYSQQEYEEAVAPHLLELARILA